MDGIHDLGGAEGFGRVVAERDEPVFHTDWERRACGLTMGTFLAQLSNGGQFRHAIERMDPIHYLMSSYYEHWLTGVATRAVEAGIVERDELERRAGGHFPLSQPVTAHPRLPSPSEAQFAVGDAVRVRNVATSGHTRCPQYVRRARGTVVRVDPAVSLPDVEAHGDERVVEPQYCVRFDLRELWGSDEAGAVHVDLWQSYLEPA
ncbi:MAG TPA: nitrile hydratase subunit beta [Acidimicrobiales bacterium]|nr:nitrile hydratase subunit beta [Acidimicrobiales bacterium]